MRENRDTYSNYIKLQETDRQRISRELHDTSLQNLTHTIYRIELAEMYLSEDPIKTKLELENIRTELKEIIEEIRKTIFDLRPMSFDDLGLKYTIIRYIQNIEKNTSLSIQYEIDDIEEDFDKNELMNIYRIIQECLLNAVKHAKANRIYLLLQNLSDEILIKVEDDGIGFERNEVNVNEHFGLTIMQERVHMMNGNYRIHTSKGNGTKIEIIIKKSGKE